MSRAWKLLGESALVAAVCLAGGIPAIAAEEEAPVPAPQPEQSGDAVGAAPVAGAVGVAPPRVVSPPPHVIGEYRVGHIHKPWLAHIFQYSAYNPYVDLIHQPYREVIYGNRHARYYTTYRNLYAPHWHEMYVPAQGWCRPGEARPVSDFDPRARAPYGAGSATYFGAY